MEYQIDCERAQRLKDAIDELAALLTVYWNTLCNNAEPLLQMDWELEDRYEMLRDATKLVRLLDLDIACYPLTESSVLLLDEEGNPLP